MGDLHLAHRQPAPAPGGVLPFAEHRDGGDLAGRGRVARVGTLEEGDPLLEVEPAHQPGLAAVEVDRAGVGGPVGPPTVHGADHAAGPGLEQLDGRPAGRPDVGEVGGRPPVGPEPAARPASQQAGLDQPVDHLSTRRTEEGEVGLGEGNLLGGRAEVGPEHVRVVRVEHGGLHRPADQRLGVVDQVGVERVVAGDQHPQGVAGATSGPPQLLPERGAGAGEADHQDGVEAGDVDAELERVGGGQPDQLAAAQLVLELAPLLGEVAAAVGRDASGQGRVDLGEQLAGGPGDLLDAAPRADEGEGADVLDDEVGEEVGGLGARGAPHRCAVLAEVGGERWLPQRERDPAARRPVLGHGGHRQPGEPAGRGLRLGHGRRRQHERRVGAVARADPPQPSEHLADVGPEDAAVVVGLVDHHEPQTGEEA